MSSPRIVLPTVLPFSGALRPPLLWAPSPPLEAMFEMSSMLGKDAAPLGCTWGARRPRVLGRRCAFSQHGQRPLGLATRSADHGCCLPSREPGVGLLFSAGAWPVFRCEEREEHVLLAAGTPVVCPACGASWDGHLALLPGLVGTGAALRPGAEGTGQEVLRKLLQPSGCVAKYTVNSCLRRI